MNWKTYNKMTEREFIGRKVKSLVQFSNGYYRFPAGMTWTLKRKHGGFDLLSDPCPHCGIQAVITKVSPIDVDFTDQANLWPEGTIKIR